MRPCLCLGLTHTQYGMMLGLGGLIGFLSSGSTVSLVAGGGAGAFLTFVGYCSYNEYTQSPVTSKLWPALSLGAIGSGGSACSVTRAWPTDATWCVCCCWQACRAR